MTREATSIGTGLLTETGMTVAPDEISNIKPVGILVVSRRAGVGMFVGCPCCIERVPFWK